MSGPHAATYSPGSWVAISTPSAWLLVDLPAGHETAQRCWSLLSAGAEVDDILDALLAGGVRAMPDFALARVSATEQRVVARGRGRVVLADGSVVEGSGAVGWAGADIAADVGLLLVGGDAQRTVELPLSSGVTMACSIDVRPSATADGSTAPISYPVAAPAPAAPVAVVEPGPEPKLEPGPEPGLDRDAEPGAAAAPPSAPEPTEHDGAGYDFLFGATQNPAALAAAEAPGAEPPPAADPSPAVPPGAPVHETASWMTELPRPSAVADGPPVGPPAAPASGLIDAVPWAVDSRAAHPATEVPPAQPPEPREVPAPPTPTAVTPTEPVPAAQGLPRSAERTVNRAALIAAAAASAASGTPISGPTVLAGLCPSGHLSPVHAAVCRVCAAAMPMQSGTEIPRPPLGVLRLSTGDVVTLDRGVLFGRAPEVPPDAAERPNAVRLVSPGNDISRTHAEVELDGWHVYIRDLGSTNGTVVTLPGQQPLRLRPHDPQLLEPGAEVSLADEVSFVFEVSG